MGKVRGLYNVYQIEKGRRYCLGDTRAVSPEQAINNVRFRLWGETSVEELGIEFLAEKVVDLSPQPPREPVPSLVQVSRRSFRQLVWPEILRRNPAF